MSEHKYNDAYNKGFEDGKKKAFDDWVYQCYDELSPKEQIELLLSKGAKLPKKAVESKPQRMWLDHADKIDAEFGRHDYMCPHCNHNADYFIGGTENWWCAEAPNYCPNCGCEMIKESNR